MKDTITKICADIESVKRGHITSPAEDAILDICERLARRIAATSATLNRKVERLDSDTQEARARTARF